VILTRTDTSATIILPDDLFWQDEAWSPVVQSAERSLTGALILQEATRVAGRPITLSGYSGQGGQGSAITKAKGDELLAWAAIACLPMTLERLGVTYNVRWNHASGSPVSLVPIIFWVNIGEDSADDPWYAPTIRLITHE